VARRIDRDVDVRGVVAVEHGAGDKPLLLDEADRAIWLGRARAELLHHPLCDSFVLRLGARIVNAH
jgi:hypothetical protein